MCAHTPQSSSPDIHTSCVMCKSEIFAGAKICPICKSYQSSCKRNAYNCATLGGIIIVAISLLTYITSTFPELRKIFFWRDVIEVTAFDSGRAIVINNSGDGKIFISHLLLSSKNINFSWSIPIDETIETKSFLVHPLKMAVKDSTQWTTVKLSEDSWQKILRTAHLMKNECIRWNYYSINDFAYQQIKTFMGKDFHEVSVDATLYFHSGHDGHLISQDIKVFAAPIMKNTKACVTPDSWFR